MNPSPDSFLGQRLAEATSPADATRFAFALEADLARLRGRLASARDAGDHAGIAFTATSLAHLLEEAGLDELLALARPLAAVLERIRPAKPAWVEGVDWLLTRAVRTLATSQGACNTPV